MRKGISVFLTCSFIAGVFWYIDAAKNHAKSRGAATGILPGLRTPASKDEKRKNESASKQNENESFDAQFERLQQDSARSWTVDRSNHTLRLQGGSLVLEGNDISARGRDFLKRYGAGLLGVRSDLVVESDSDARMVRYKQTEDGLDVWNSKIALFFDENGNLVHVVSETHGGKVAKTNALDIAGAAALARAALAKYVVGARGNVGDYDSVNMSGKAFLYGQDPDKRLMYRFVIPLVRPLGGEYEILVDATVGQIFSAQNSSRQ